MREETKPDVYAARIKDKQIVLKSSSGGAFTAIADYFLDNGNAVACCCYSSDKARSEYKLFFSKKDIEDARGSKYMYSFLDGIYNECVQWLYNNPDKHLLFIGTGCQAAGFCCFAEAKQLRNRVFVVDLICHGLPSPMIWDSYVCYLKNKYSNLPESVSFRDKSKGWEVPTPYAVINGEKISLHGYVRMYYDVKALRPSCYQCPYTTMARYTDITIGDYWGIEKTLPEFYDPEGNSLILVHTQTGRDIFDKIKDNLEYVKSNTEDCWQYNLEFPTKKPPDREQFWKDYYNRGSMYIIKKYAHPSLFRKISDRIKKYIRRRAS